MHIGPELAALRSDAAPQRVAQEQIAAALDQWRQAPQVATIVSDLERYAAGESALGELAALFGSDDAPARDFVDSFIASCVAVMAEAPLAHVALRHFTNGIHSTLMLARSKGATLSLVAIDGERFAATPPARTVDFGPVETTERVLAGSARAAILRRIGSPGASVRIDSADCALEPGMVLHRDGLAEALQMRAIDRRIVLLRLQRRPDTDEPMREYCLGDGALVHQSAGRVGDSRAELAIALLARMGRADAAPAMARIAQGTGGEGLRWQALRECIALDTETGFAALCSIARNSGDVLCAPAAALRGRLIEMHPPLEAIETCPA